jgi:hypothetical protein
MHNFTQSKTLVAVMLGGELDREGRRNERGGRNVEFLNVVNVVPNKKCTVQGDHEGHYGKVKHVRHNYVVKAVRSGTYGAECHSHCHCLNGRRGSRSVSRSVSHSVCWSVRRVVHQIILDNTATSLHRRRGSNSKGHDRQDGTESELGVDGQDGCV